MPATWNDLPNELRQIIIEYVVAGKLVRFAPQHRAKLRAAQKEAIGNEQRHLPFLLVSKRFLRLEELRAAVLRCAIVKYHNHQDLQAIEARIGKNSLENIRNLNILCIFPAQMELVTLSKKTLAQLKRLECVIIGNISPYPITDMSYNPDDLLAAAKGQLPTSKYSGILYPTLEALVAQLQFDTHNILSGLIQTLDHKSADWIISFLAQTSERPFEKRLQFRIWNYRLVKEYTEVVEFSSTLLCCRLVRYPSILMPQRLRQSCIDSFPSLAAINEVPL